MKIRLNLLLCSCLLLLTHLFSDAYGQIRPKGSISGIVKSSDNKPAENIIVILKGTHRGTVTDPEGHYAFDNLAAGDYMLEVSFAGLKPQQVQVTLRTGEDVIMAPVVLEENTKKLQEVVVVGAVAKFAKKQSDDVARMPLKNLENPQVYTVVPKELLQEQMAVDFRSALATAPGISNVTLGVGSGGVGLGMRMRGFSGSNAAGAIRNGMSTNWVSMSDPVNLESIEVIKGPSATLFGSTLVTYGGLVNRVTKKPFDYFGGNISYTTGSWGLSRATIDINTPLNAEKGMLLRVNAAVDVQRTFQDYGRNNTQVIAPAFTYKINDRLTLDVDFEYFRTKRNSTYIGLGNPGPLKAKSLDDLNFDFNYSYTNNELQSEAKTFNAFAKATYRLSDQWVSQTLFSYANTDNNTNYLFLLINTDSTMQRRLMYIPSIFGVNHVQQNFTGDFHIGNMRNRLLVGLDYSQFTITDNRWLINFYDTVKINRAPAFINMEKYHQRIANMPAPSTVAKKNQKTYSVYASDVLNITSRLIAMASVRVDRFESEYDDYQQTAVSPKFGLIYQIVKDKVSLFGNYMNGFSNVPPGTTAEKPQEKTSFKPEHANQLEGGIKVELLNGKLSGTASYYNIKVKDKLRQDPNNPTYSIQDGTQESKGFEADLIANPLKGLHIIFGYGYNESRFTNATANINGKRPASTPASVANLWISYTVPSGPMKGLGAGFGGNTQSDCFLNDTNTFTANGFTKLDATLYYDQPKYRLGLKLNNITNQKYWTTDFWANQQPTRHLLANAVFKF
ncbi:TonB-dependent receptor [Chitinophaga flava]|uniref:TonB-dependent siderophore receptor n=1 Tax=Chitinophaga flava TaxID=2259036 RepID=A0A365XXA1_9BACT|nr:TonB-dependent receptor [Chitinophaga flava]RBL90986.1 TonB-dependent siderophore receptor [Chitinophaga flava]